MSDLTTKLVWTYTIEHNRGLYNVVGTDGKTQARLVASCLHEEDAKRIWELYALQSI